MATPASSISRDTFSQEPDLRVSLTPLGDPAALEQEWRALERSASASFFLSWDWMGAFLDSVTGLEAPKVLRVAAGTTPKGIALVWSSQQSRHRIVRTRSIHFNETGRPEFDRITMEHNGILAVTGEEAAVTNAAIGYLASNPGWDECFLSGLDEGISQLVDTAAQQHKLRYQKRWAKQYHFVNLDDVRLRGTYLDSLSANTRYQARRAIKAYSVLGNLECRRASSANEAEAWFGDLMRLHQAHWIARGEPGAFSSSFTRQFHTKVIANGWANGTVSLLRVMAGATLLGYVYNFERDGTASNYQSGHVAAEDNKLKPGLVVHCVAVQDALQRGLHTYDLLMGGDHFKPSLCNASGLMSWNVLQQRRLTLGIENQLRKMRNHWQERSQSRKADQAHNTENMT